MFLTRKVAVRRRGIAVAGIIALSSLTSLNAPGVVAVASAHDVVLHSTPEDGATVAKFPRTIVLEFSGIPKDNFNTIAVSDSANGQVLFSAEPHRNKQVMSVAVPDDIHPGPGHYIVGFQITSSDGHATRGKTTFTVAPQSAAMPSQASAASQEQDSPAPEGGMSLGAIVGIMALVAVCVGVIITIKKRK